MSKKFTHTHALAESAIMVALSIAIFLVSDMIPWPFLIYGGSFSLFGQVPIILVSYRHGIRNGLAASTTNFIIISGPIVMTLSNFSPPSSISQSGTQTLPCLP